jgi:hypothetical protein
VLASAIYYGFGRPSPADDGPREVAQNVAASGPALASPAGKASAKGAAEPSPFHPLDPVLWAEIVPPFELYDAIDPAVQQLRSQYGVELYLPRSAVLDVEGKLTGSRPTAAQISAAALALQRELARYPREFITAIAFQRLVLIEGVKLRGVPAGAFVMAPAGTMIATATGLSDPLRVHHEIFHFADYRLNGRPPDDRAWTALNSAGMSYGRGGRQMVASAGGEYSRLIEARRDLPGFVTAYAQSAPEEDRAEVFATLVTRQTLAAELAASDPVIAAKMRYVGDALERLHPGTRAAVIPIPFHAAPR